MVSTRSKDTEVLATKEVELNGKTVQVSLLKSYIYGSNKSRYIITPRARYKTICEKCGRPL